MGWLWLFTTDLSNFSGPQSQSPILIRELLTCLYLSISPWSLCGWVGGGRQFPSRSNPPL